MGIFDKASCDSLEESDNAITDVESVKKTKKKRKSMFDIGTDDNNVPYKKQQEVFENNQSAKTGRHTTVNCDESIKYISQKLTETPSGIIECKVPHIGAVHLEIHTKRNSIVIVQNKDVALFYKKTYKDICFVSDLYDKPEDEWEAYEKKHQFKKVITSVDSSFLPKDYKHYFVLIKDIDELQSDYLFKSTDILDLYFSLPRENRCFYTADSKRFTHPQMSEENLTVINWCSTAKAKIELQSCKDIVGRIKNAIEEIPSNERILVLYSSVQQAKISILNLKEVLQKESAIICKESDKEEAGCFFRDISSINDKLPARISFLTEKYPLFRFSEQLNLIIVSDTSKGSTTLSVKQILRAFYLSAEHSRISKQIVIHNTAYCWEEDWNRELVKLEERGEKIVLLMNGADTLAEDDISLKGLFSMAQTVLLNRAKGGIRGRFSRVPLVHKNIVSKPYKWEVNYMSIDSLVLRTNLLVRCYSSKKKLMDILKKYSVIVSYSADGADISETQKQIIKKERALTNMRSKQVRNEILDIIVEYFDNNKAFRPKEDLGNMLHIAETSIQKKTILEVRRLYEYIDINELASLLKGIKSGSSIGFKNLNNRIMVWALEEEHPLKADVHNTFEIGKIYTNEEINEKLSPIVKYHFNRDFIKEKENKAKTSQKGSKEETSKTKGRKLITIFKYFFETERITRKGYLIKDYTSFEDTDKANVRKRKRISKDDNNLMRYFML